MAFTKKENRTTKSNNRDDRPQAKIWLNVGFQSVNQETGEPEFISLPMGIALDTMEPKRVGGSNEDYNRLMTAKNQLMEMLQKFADGFESGQEEIIPDLQVQIRRTAETDEANQTTDGNPHLKTLSGLSFAATSKAA